MSTSSSDPKAETQIETQTEIRAWRRFVVVLLAVTAAIVLTAFAFVAIVDPYDSLAFSPPWKRYRVTTNERYAFPGMIRHGQFDSAVFVLQSHIAGNAVQPNIFRPRVQA